MDTIVLTPHVPLLQHVKLPFTEMLTVNEFAGSNDFVTVFEAHTNALSVAVNESAPRGGVPVPLPSLQLWVSLVKVTPFSVHFQSTKPLGLPGTPFSSQVKLQLKVPTAWTDDGPLGTVTRVRSVDNTNRIEIFLFTSFTSLFRPLSYP